MLRTCSAASAKSRTGLNADAPLVNDVSRIICAYLAHNHLKKRFCRLFSASSTLCQAPVMRKPMKSSRKATIRDVAAAAGVSLTTVSDALSGKGRLPEATRLKVHEVAAQLDYRPSAIARGLRVQSLGLIGISIATAEPANISDVWNWASLALKASDTALQEGFAPVLLPHSVSSLQRLRVPLDGAIVVDPLEDDEVLAFFLQRNIKVVTIGYDINNPGTPWIDDDTENGIVKLLGSTVAPGEAIAVVTYGPRKSFVVEALRGMAAWAVDTGSALHELHCDDLDDSTVDAILRTVLARRHSVIVTQNDRVAVKILSRLKSMKVSVPEAVRLISVTDAPGLQNTSPTITALRQNPATLGQIAANALLNLIRGVEAEAHPLLPLEVVVRESAPALATSHDHAAQSVTASKARRRASGVSG